MVFFDLPVKTKTQRREATRFRNFLLMDGYHMLQYSVYARVCNGMDAVEKHRQRVKQNLPDNGAIRLMVITEKQYEAIDVLSVVYYTIPRTTRELQLDHSDTTSTLNYTIPRTTRELQQPWRPPVPRCHYTIPRTTRELQRREPA